MKITNILTEQEIIDRFNVTAEQIDKAMRVIDCNKGQVFYQVSSQTTAETVYEVRYNQEFKRLTCDCKAGQVGVPCWHKRAAMAAALIYKQEQRIQNAREQEEQEAVLYQARMRKLEEQKAEAEASVRDLKNPAGTRQCIPFSILK